MKEKIQDKIHAHIESILKKDAIDFGDYQVLCNELTRLEAEEKSKATANESNGQLWKTLLAMIMFNGIDK